MKGIKLVFQIGKAEASEMFLKASAYKEYGKAAKDSFQIFRVLFRLQMPVCYHILVCVFLAGIWSDFRMRQYRDFDHRKQATHFNSHLGLKYYQFENQ